MSKNLFLVLSSKYLVSRLEDVWVTNPHRPFVYTLICDCFWYQALNNAIQLMLRRTLVLYQIIQPVKNLFVFLLIA